MPSQGRRGDIEALVGTPATDLVYQQMYWLRVGAVALLLDFIGLLVVGAAHAQHNSPWALIGALFLLVVVCGVRGAALGNRAGRAGSEFVSRQVGYTVRFSSGGMRPWLWRKNIAKATKGQLPAR